MIGGGEQVLDESQALEGYQGFGLAHSPRFSGSENGHGEFFHALVSLEKSNFGKFDGFIVLVRGISADRDQFGGDANSDFFGSERANVQSRRSIDSLKLGEVDAFFFQRFVHGDHVK